MRAIPIRHVDVFTDKPFSGNPLTVVPDARNLTDSEMQAVAAEFGTPETSFIVPPKSDVDYGLRIFSPIKEIPFAGHPVIGAAHVFVSEQNEETTSILRQETGVGPLSIQVVRDREPPKLIMDQGKPKTITTLSHQQVKVVTDTLQIEEKSHKLFTTNHQHRPLSTFHSTQ